MSKESADAFQECCGKLFVISRVHTSMAPEVSFAKVQEITDALSRACSMASHTAAPLVAGLKRFVEQRILPNGALEHITEQGFRLPADEAEAAAAKEAEMNRKHSPKHSPKDLPEHSPKHSPKPSPKHSSPRHSGTLAGAPAPLPLWEKGLRNARAA
ncbi:hypothetical protein Ctob_015817 [Chrysochromulina tobinii]|uniref:Uncharacterized protein n=1 Tax=Chrysochromulina tobinii TaxID=1460289 RepID=A0A0M0K2V7_9EUKA|nr:hypothetical protein Ctob_015817 [Chrysochromulina tobinii]|eukprot:KOO32927.1 hypothetical protein Ctob_015817 [Chrysochromulina sp. CCMP291]